MTYLRPGSDKHAPGVEETTVVFVVDAWNVATQDAAVGDAIAKAKAAVTAEERAQQELAAAEDSLTEAEQVRFSSTATCHCWQTAPSLPCMPSLSISSRSMRAAADWQTRWFTSQSSTACSACL